MVVEIDKVADKAKTKGKWCHFEKKDFERHGLMDYYWKNIKDVNPSELKEKIVTILKSEGFIFFPDIEYKVITKFGNLTEVAVNFWHIE